MITKKKAVPLIKFGRTIDQKKWDYSSVKRLLEIFRENGSMDGRHGSGRPRTFFGRKHGFDGGVSLLTGRAK